MTEPLYEVGNPVILDFFTINTGGGSGDDTILIHDQTIAMATWTISHSFNRPPIVSIIDSTGKVIYTDIDHSTGTSVVLTFNSPITGKAILT